MAILPKIDNTLKLPIKYSEVDWTIRWLARAQYAREQDGKCYHCKASLEGEPSKEVLSKPITKKLFPKTMFDHPVHLHHDHTTDLTIGAVHCYCNAVLWEHYGE